MDVAREFQASLRRQALTRDALFLKAEARLLGKSPEELVAQRTLPQMEVLGAALREFSDAWNQMWVDFARGWDQAGKR